MNIPKLVPSLGLFLVFCLGTCPLQADWKGLAPKVLKSEILGKAGPILTEITKKTHFITKIAPIKAYSEVQAKASTGWNLFAKSVNTAAKATLANIQNHPYFTACLTATIIVAAYVACKSYFNNGVISDQSKQIPIPRVNPTIQTNISSLQVSERATLSTEPKKIDSRAVEQSAAQAAQSPAKKGIDHKTFVQSVAQAAQARTGLSIGQWAAQVRLTQNPLANRVLNLANQGLTNTKGIDILSTRLPHFKHADIQVIDLSYNNLSELDREFVEFVKKCPNLKEIRVTGNSRLVSIPPAIVDKGITIIN